MYVEESVKKNVCVCVYIYIYIYSNFSVGKDKNASVKT